ncbi:MAG: hypothetical protein HYS12_17345 [Planctomycetes bacterium]|nr:hypothetical protein [Planctomycetota bacterium]
MPAEVVIEAAGDHAFDLGHLRRQGGEELLLRLLHEAGLDDRRWRLRVEKKVACGAETRPVTVVGFKPWCCYVKIKPGDNNSGHYCSLLMPDGLRGEAVYEALKGAEERIDRNWRNGPKEPMELARLASVAPDDRGAEAPAAPGPDEPAEDVAAPGGTGTSGPPVEEPGRGDLRSWGKEPEKIRLVLLATHEVEQAGPWPARDDFVSAVADRLGWKDVDRHAIGRVFAVLVRGKYLCQARRGSRGAGYTLTDKGRQLIQDLMAPPTPPTPPTPPPAPAPPVSAAAVVAEQLSQGLEGFAQRFTEASQRLRAIRSRRAELLAEITQLDEEARGLEQLLGNAEVHALIRRLLEAGGKPGKE